MLTELTANYHGRGKTRQLSTADSKTCATGHDPDSAPPISHVRYLLYSPLNACARNRELSVVYKVQ